MPRYHYTQLGIEDLAALRRAAESGRIQTVPGFGEKTEQRILSVLAAQREKKARIPRHAAEPEARALLLCLEEITRENGWALGSDTLAYWRRAAAS